MFVDILFSTEEMKERKRGLEKSGQQRRMSWRYGRRVGNRCKKERPSRRTSEEKAGIETHEKERQLRVRIH